MPHENNGPERDPNFFVNFRRFADDHVGSALDSVADPFRRYPRHDEQWRKNQEDMWKRFERSYERATNPERRQIDSVGEGASRTASTPPSDRIQDMNGNNETVRRMGEQQQQGLFARMLGFLGKTSTEEESARIVGNYWKDIDKKMREDENHRIASRSQILSPKESVRDQNLLKSSQTQARGNASEPQVPGDRTALQETTEEQGRAEDIGRRIDRCPWVREQAEKIGETQSQHSDSPYTWSWSWGPWSYHMGLPNQQRTCTSTADEAVPQTRTEEHTFGPWSFGPFHIGSMSMSASFPRDMEAEINRVWEEMDKRRQELVAQMSESHQRLEKRFGKDDESQSGDADSEQYSPVDLMKRPDFGGHINWRQAYEDLLAAETGEIMLGGTPWSSAENESNDSWRARLRDRGLLDSKDAWHRQMVRLDSGAEPDERPGTGPTTQISQDAPHSELEFYDAVSPGARNDLKTQQQPSQARSDILSTLTTVESITNPDGSTTVKRSLKRHFADGRIEREDSTESSPTMSKKAEMNSEPSEQASPPLDTRLVKRWQGQKDSKGSWFWS